MSPAPDRKKKLIVCVGERLSAIVSKGEISPRYYNPGELFDEIHFFTLKDDDFRLESLKPATGKASIHIHTFNADSKLLAKTLGFRPFLMKKWAEAAVKEAAKIGPALIRCHGTGVHSYLAACIKKKLGTPYIVSLHSSAHCKALQNAMSFTEKLAELALKDIQLISLNEADVIVPVYRGILKTLEWLGANPQRMEIIYNAVNHDNIEIKKDYARAGRLKLLHVGRYKPSNGVENIIRAMQLLPEAELTLIGDSPKRIEIEALADSLGLSERINFIKSMANNEICRSLKNYDIYLYFGRTAGISKGTIEALLTGLPVIANRQEEAVDEHEGGHLALAELTAEAYASEIRNLMDNEEERQKLGLAGLSYASSMFSRETTEMKMASLYRELAKEE